MKKSLLFSIALLLFSTSMLSGCIWWGWDDGYRRGEIHERGGGDHHEEHHEHHDDRGERR